MRIFRMQFSIVVCVATLFCMIGLLQAQDAAKPSAAANPAESSTTKKEVVKRAVAAAEKFLETVEQSQYEKVMYSFTDDNQRENWSNLPVGNVPRGGLRWGDLSETQKDAAMGLLKATLSEYGVQQVVDNMNGDEFLRVNGRGRNSFGSDEYFISFLGEPSTTSPWMYQFGGHHLAINVTMVGDEMTMSPSLTGGQPIDFEWKGKKVRQIAEEEDAAFKLISSLKKSQLKKAVVGAKYGDINFGPNARSIKPQSEGISVAEFDESQQALLKKLIGYRISVLNPVHANGELEKIVAEFPNTWFSWRGSFGTGGAASFRVQSPKILMEFSPQRLGGVPMNHIHAMYRDPSNDYGVGFIDAMRKKRKGK